MPASVSPSLEPCTETNARQKHLPDSECAELQTNHPARDKSVISLSSDSESSGSNSNVVGNLKSRGSVQAVPARSLVPVRQNAIQNHVGEVLRLGIPSGFPVHPCDVIPMAQRGYNTLIDEIAARQGFQPSIAQEVYSHVSSLEQMEEILRAMQEAANRCGEIRIGKLAAHETEK